LKPQQTAAVIAILALLAVIAAVLKPPKFGLDINGGARVVLQADTAKLPKGQAWNAESREAVLRTIERRVNANGVSEPVITPKGSDQFVVEIPSVRNREEILEQLQNTAQLQFYYSPDWRTSANRLGRYSLEPQSTDDGKREQYLITDATTSKSFRDPYHINLALRDLTAGAAKAGTAAVETPLPSPLDELPVVAGRKTVPLDPKDAPTLAKLADELTQFRAFLGGAQLEMDGSDLKVNGAHHGFDPSGAGKAIVDLEFNSAGRDKFAEFTRNHTNEILMIYLDGQILMAPNINEPILNGRAQISPFATLEDAKSLSDYLNSGALPVPLHILQQQTVEPTLGRGAVTQGVTAGIIGFVAVVLFMAVYYLLPGAVACAALVLYTLFTYAAFVLIGVTFTLPGIAGFILSVGMAVDANILIFERTKEELRDGRPLRQAIEHGFQRAFSAILDSNVCTAVTSLLLYYFGTGPVRGFALTLLIGVAISMFTAITVSRTLLLLLVKNRGTQNLQAWGVQRQWHPRFNVVGKRGLWYALSVAIIVPTVVFAALGGFKPGIDFTGGNEFTLRFTQPVKRDDVERAFAQAGVPEAAAQIAGDNTVFVRIPQASGKAALTGQQATDLVNRLGTSLPGVRLEGFEQIGSSISGELTRNAFLSILLSSLFIVFYLAMRFAVAGFNNGIKFGIAAVIAMLHDVFVLIGMFCALGYFLNWKIDTLFVTAALTVIGFSVHDTIVIFDRIRENLRESHKEGRRDADFGALVNRSIQETFARSINTSFTVVITLTALLIFGGPVIRPLNAALLIGIISGTYSSIFNAAPLIVDWQKRFGGGLALAGRPAREGQGQVPAAPRPAPASPRATGASATDVGTNGASTTSGDGTGTTAPRPTLPPGPPGQRPRRRRM
jgi:SecD/SecF fusion protein